MPVTISDQKDLISKYKDGTITEAEKMRLFSRGGLVNGAQEQKTTGEGTEAQGYEGAEVDGFGPRGTASQVAGTANKTMSALGKSNTAISTGVNFAGGLIDGASPEQMTASTGLGLTQMGTSLLGPVGGLISAGIGAATSANPGQAATAGLGSMLGGAVGGMVTGGNPLGVMGGSMAGGYLGDMAYGSFSDGMLGDAVDSRSFESRRDMNEQAGMSRQQSAEDAAELEDHMTSLKPKTSQSSQENVDTRTDYGKGLNNAGLLGDKDLSPEQNMDRQPNETPGGLLGDEAASSFGEGGGGMGDSGGRSQGDPDGDAGSDPN